MYSAYQSRFTTQDPAGMQEGPNMYAYVGNNPVNQRDPSGLGPGEDKIDGGGGGSDDLTPCPELGWNYFFECVIHWDGRTTHPEKHCAEICFNYDYDSGGGGLPDGVECVLGELAVSAALNPACYWLCGGALNTCWYLTSPTAIATCVGAGCICAAPDIIMAISACI